MKEEKRKSKLPQWLVKMGWGMFFLFLLKGLIWLAIFYGLFDWFSK